MGGALDALLAVSSGVAVVFGCGAVAAAALWRRAASQRDAARAERAVAVAERDDARAEVDRGDAALATARASLEEFTRSTRERERRITRDLRELEILRGVVEHMGDGLIAVDDQRQFVVFNPAASRILGISSPMGATLGDWSEDTGFFGADGVTPLQRHEFPLARAMAGERVPASDLYVSRPDLEGGIWVSLSATPIASKTPGKMQGAITVLRDVTTLRGVEQERDRLVATLSREIRSPLNAMVGSLGLALGGAAGAMPEDVGGLVAAAQANAQRLLNLANGVLDMSNLEAGKLDLQRESTPAEAVADLVCALAEPMSRELGIGVVREVRTTRRVQVDRARIAQALSNLVFNALRFSPEGGAVRLVVEDDGRGVRFAVHDDGPGIPADQLSAVFQRFPSIRGPDGRVRPGTGLGLWLAKALVERHGGKIALRSESGRGTTAEVTLPGA